MKSYTTAHKPEITVVGIKCPTSNSPEASALDIPKLSARFYSENIPAQISNYIGDFEVYGEAFSHSPSEVKVGIAL